MEALPTGQNRLFDRTHIGDHGFGRQSRQQLGGRIQEAIQGERQNNQLAPRKHARFATHHLSQLSFPGPLSCPFSMNQSSHLKAKLLQIEAE
jgi:hypothetical protein